MNISKNSWHYRLLGKFDLFGVPSSLCPYFWAVVASLFIVVTAGVSVITLVISFASAPLALFYSMDEIVEISKLLAGVVSLGFVEWVFVCFMFFIWGTVVGIKYIKRKIQNQSVDKEPNILVEYVKAKHKKFCPKITFK